ncbi:hypothetical protein Tco_0287159 [Tanacetum coccineum]
MHEMRNKYQDLRDNHDPKNHLNDDKLMCERHEANYIKSEDYQNQDSHNSFSRQSHHDPYDPEKSLTELNNDVRNDFEDFQKIVSIAMKLVKWKLLPETMMERKMDEWSKSQNVSSEQTDRTEPQPPPQAHTEQVNAVFTWSGKSDDPSKTQKDSPPPIIVNNKIKKDKPIKTSKKDYQVIKTNEYPFREYIPKIQYPQALRVVHSHLNCIIKES